MTRLQLAVGPSGSADPTVMSPVSATLRRHIVWGGGIVAVLFAICVLWLVFAQLSGAVVATGKLVVESNVKDVQHSEGGIVGQINVKNGDRVSAGDLLIRLDDTMARASLGIVETQLSALIARRMRLSGERDNLPTLEVPAAFIDRQSEPKISELITAEVSLFAARKSSLEGEKEQLRQKLLQLSETVSGLTAQKNANEEERHHIVDELTGLETLFAKQLVPITRVAALRRERASLDGRHGELTAQIASTRMQISETEMQILQLDRDRQTEVLGELTDIDQQIAQLMQREIALRDQLRRIDIRAPYDGTVYQMAVHTVGGVIGPGDRLMGIVPDQDELVIEAHVNPRDIEQVMLGQDAMLRFTAFNQSTTPELSGQVSFVSADLDRDELTGETFYIVRVSITAGEVAKLDGRELVPGMPVETFLATGQRTALSYLLKPLSDQFARAFRED
ncbi:HlyD family type I secretion periplasmic adaptor subunit [Thalassospira profundimaris]|uniref:HlyD family type I secretion periplasmic adaptor subunit n=1 Tax=Thalassospira profundimaris TaxID=502049 RepID=UPI00028728F7|nr:HlyD family type I secretion periplasmic adaptor subunit [Thalassospira profundimaris]EKF10245.1 HlyD family type I secretion membrane fusion protein [Thalassospira profundimaris WP0211]